MVSTAELISAVNRSPAALAECNKDQWLALFSDTAQIHDPVGSQAHSGPAAIERFYHAFIEPNSISFDIQHDVTAEYLVFRDLFITTTMASGVTLQVPMHLRYNLISTSEGLKIDRLAAHWELSTMVKQLLNKGKLGLLSSLQLGHHLLKTQGLQGSIGFCQAFHSVGNPGKKIITDLTTNSFSAHPALCLGNGAHIGVVEFITHMRNIRICNLIAAGRNVTATVYQGDLRGIALFTFEDRRLLIAKAEIFLG
ncbi:MAG: nuclear transport factor 2 family protein [Mycobacteriaceae bacterium]